MGSGDPVVQILSIMPLSANFAPPGIRAGGSTPAEMVDVFLFDAAAIEYLDFKCLLKGYGGGGLTFTLPWSAASAISNTTRWEIAIRRMQDDLEDIDTSHSYSYQVVDDTAPSVSGELSYPTIALTNGAQMDSWADGEIAIVRVRRNGTHANDNMSGDAELWGMFGKET